MGARIDCFCFSDVVNGTVTQAGIVTGVPHSVECTIIGIAGTACQGICSLGSAATAINHIRRIVFQLTIVDDHIRCVAVKGQSAVQYTAVHIEIAVICSTVHKHTAGAFSSDVTRCRKSRTTGNSTAIHIEGRRTGPKGYVTAYTTSCTVRYGATIHIQHRAAGYVQIAATADRLIQLVRIHIGGFTTGHGAAVQIHYRFAKERKIAAKGSLAAGYRTTVHIEGSALKLEVTAGMGGRCTTLRCIGIGSATGDGAAIQIHYRTAGCVNSTATAVTVCCALNSTRFRCTGI